jgi:methylated-DNA-[protein]-cysteine S-methyltransferase
MMVDKSYFFESPLGILAILASQKGITNIIWGMNDKRICYNPNKEACAHRATCIQQLSEYFADKRTEFTIPLDFTGTSFQHSVWTALLQIPFGKTMSYKELATTIGNENSSRAVGMATNKNPLPIIIPCHRIIGSSGKLVGYSAGLNRKELLLAHESSLKSISRRKK